MNTRTPIGFIKEQHPEPQQQAIHPDRMAQLRGWEQARKILEEYFSPHLFPFVTGEARNEKYIKKLEKVKIRYFDPI